MLVYAQHLSGVGHYVRTFEIARALAPRHHVYWVEGGRPVPRPPCPGLQVVELPRIRRGADGRLQAVSGAADVRGLLRERANRLLGAVKGVRPEILLVEYFPFSKWELADELLPAISAARNMGGRVLCSLRDVVPKTRFEEPGPDTYAARVTALLNRYFDALLVHADPRLTRLEEHFPALADIRVPIHYTGIVSEKFAYRAEVAAEIERRTSGRPFVLASAGGGAGGRRLIQAAVRAWRDPGIAGGRVLVVCNGLEWNESPPGDRVITLPFRSDFLNWLAQADLSISQCGYNTVANVLETRVPSVVCPNPDMSDQPFRARRLAERGVVELCEDEQRVSRLSEAVERALARAGSPHGIDLNGALRTRSLIEADDAPYGGHRAPAS